MFYDALLHILDPVMIFIQDLSHPRKFETIYRGLAPRQFQQQLQVAADDLMLWRGRGNLRKPPKFTVGFLADVLRQAGLLNAFLELADVALIAVVFAQLLLDRLQLLPEQVFPL